MSELTEAEIQVLIAALEATTAGKPVTREHLDESKGYFSRSLTDWTAAIPALSGKRLLTTQGDVLALTGEGYAAAERLRQARPRMWYWYSNYYPATRASAASAEFCKRVYGRNFAQHGFSDMQQVNSLIAVLKLGPANRVLEIGCGNGGMAEYISEATGAYVTGIDFIPEAISQAQERARANARLSFQVMDIGSLSFRPASFDTIVSVDTLYFTDLHDTIKRLKDLLVIGGQMGIFYSYGWEPWVDKATFPRDMLPAGRTPLAQALAAAGLTFQAQDFTADDYRLARLKLQIAEELRPRFEAEGNLFLYQNRHDEAQGVMAACAAGLQARYLYHVTMSAFSP